MNEARVDGEAGILRGVVLHGQPLTLARPRVAPALLPAAVAVQSADRAPSREAIEEAIAAARAEGFALGRAEEAQARRGEWESAVAAAKAQAQEDGRALGVEQGLREAAVRTEQARGDLERDLRERIARVEKLLASAQAHVDEWRAESEEDLVALSYEIAARVLGARATERQAREQMTRQVLREHGSRTALAVHVHPDDFECIAHDAPAANARWEWVSDPGVATGGVVLRSPQGSLDARIDTQMRALGEALVAHRDERKRKQAEGLA